MVAIKLHVKSRALLFQGLKLFKKVDHAIGIVAGLVHVLYAKVIGLGLERAAKLAKSCRHSVVSSLARAQAGKPPGHDDHRYHGDLGHGSARDSTRRMARRHMPNFM